MVKNTVKFNWYVLQVYSGFEKKIVEEIMKEARKQQLDRFIKEIYIPLEKVSYAGRMGKKVVTEKNTFPGYVLVHCALLDHVHSMLLNVERVSNFLCASGKPVVISEKEVDVIKARSEASLSQEIKDDFRVGETIKVEHGAFAGFDGIIKEIGEGQKFKVEVTIFGRPVMLDLTEKDIKKK